MKIFISMPMRGRTSDEINASINKLKDKFRAKMPDAEFIHTIVMDTPPETGDQRVWYLGKSIEKLSQADIIAVPVQNDSNPGCKVEELVAVLYGIDIAYYSPDDI